jgi:branched-chain amino acid transport system permease protein
MWDVVVLGLLAGGVLALIAVGLTLIFGVMDVVNFAHGEFVMFGMMGTALLGGALQISPYVAGLLVAVLSVPAAVVVYFLVIRPTLGRTLYVQVFATLGLSIVLQAAALIAFGPRTVAIRDDTASTRISLLGVPVELGRLIAFAVAVVLVVATWVFLTRARAGQEIRAVAEDNYAARVVGIRVSRAYLSVFVVGALFAVIAGAVIVPFQSVTPTSGVTFALTSFVVVVLGGFGSLPGALAGGLVIGVVETAAGYYLGTEWSQASLFVVFMLVLLLRPSGLFGRRAGDAELVGGH